MADEKIVKKPFEIWTVKEVDYKLRLSTADIQLIESKYDKSIVEIFVSTGTPPLFVMLDILHLAMQKFQHGIDRKEVNNIFDDYIDEGGNVIDFYTKTFLGIGVVSGFFTNQLIQAIQEDIAKMES